MTSGSEVMCRKKVDTPWSIYRVFTVGSKEKVEDLCEYDLYKYYTPIKKLSTVNQYRKKFCL